MSRCVPISVTPSVPLSLSVNHLGVTLGLAIVFGLSFRLGLGWLFYVSSRRKATTLYDVYRPHFSPEVMVKFTRKARGHFVTLTESSMPLVECISGHNWAFRALFFVRANRGLVVYVRSYMKCFLPWFSIDHFGKYHNILMQHLRGHTKSIMVFSEVAY